jgi:hypothetical protein
MTLGDRVVNIINVKGFSFVLVSNLRGNEYTNL